MWDWFGKLNLPQIKGRAYFFQKAILDKSDLNYENPEICWEAILEILERNPSDKVIGVLAAGPLEDLIEVHGPLFIDRIETEARRNPRFRHLLGDVWQSSTPEIWARVEKARIKAW